MLKKILTFMALLVCSSAQAYTPPPSATAPVQINANMNISCPSCLTQINVNQQYGAVGDGSTDNAAAVQTAINANQNATIYFPLNGSNNYKMTGPIHLTDPTTGHNFQGNIVCQQGVTLTFINNGNATDADSAVQNGFQAYPRTNGSGGDTTGWNSGNVGGGLIENCNMVGPLHGASVHTGNSLGLRLINVSFSNIRYGFLGETNINDALDHVSCSNFKNACIAMLETGNSNIYYGSNPASTFWNDNYSIDHTVCYNVGSFATGTLACILDAGSQSERIRRITNTEAYTDSTSGLQYAYVARNVSPEFNVNWTENVNYPVRLIASNGNEGGSTTTLPGVSGAEPSGTWQIGNFPDGYSDSFRAFSNYFQNGKVDLDVSGVTSGAVSLGQNSVNSCQSGGYHIQTNQGGTTIFDLGDKILSGSCSYKNINYSSYVSIVGMSSDNSGNYTATSFNGTTINAGSLSLVNNAIEQVTTNANAEIAANYQGYQGGSTQYRDFNIYNGKGSSIAVFQGSTSRLGIGTLSPGYTLDVNGVVNAATQYDVAGSQISFSNIAGTLGVSAGGTNCTSAGITCINNILGTFWSGYTGTNSGQLVSSVSPNLTTPSIGVASATQLNVGGSQVGSSIVSINATNGLTLNAATGSNQNLILFDRNGSNRYQVGQNSDDTFLIYDNVNSVGVIQSSTGGVLYLDQSAKGASVGTNSPQSNTELTINKATSTSNATTYALYAGGAMSAASTGAQYGGLIKPTYTTTGTLANQYGLELQPQNTSTGTVTTMQAMQLLPGNTSTGTVTSMYGFYIQPYGNTGSTTSTYYGLYLDTPSGGGTFTTKYGVYENDSGATNTFAGPSTFSNATIKLSGLASTSGNDIVCYTSSTGLLTYATSVAGCVPSALAYKELVGEIDPEYASTGIDSLTATVFTYKDTKTYGDQPYVGLIADDVEKMDNRCAVYKDGKVDNYDQRCMIAYLVADAQETHKKITELTAQLSAVPDHPAICNLFCKFGQFLEAHGL